MTIGRDAPLNVRAHMLRGGAWAILGRGGETLFTLLETALLSRLLLPAEMGVYFLSFSVIVAVGTLGQFGLGQAVIFLIGQSMAGGGSSATVRIIQRVLLLGSLGAVAGGALLALGPGEFLVVHMFKAPAMRNVLVPLGLLSVTWTLRTLAAESLRGLSDIRFASIFSRLSVSAGTVLVYGVIWVWRGSADLLEVLLILLASSAASTVAAWLVLRKKLKKMGREAGPSRSPAIVRAALPIFLSAVTTLLLSYVNLWMLGVFADEMDVALYGAALRLSAAVIIPLMVVYAVIAPVIAQLYAAGKQEQLERVLRGSAGLAMCVGFLGGLILILWGREVLEIFLEPFYGQAATALSIITVAQLVNLTTGACGLALVQTGHQRVLLLITVAVGVLSTVLGLALIPSYQLLGAAISSSVSLVALQISCWIAVRKRVGIWTHASLSGWPEILRSVLKPLLALN